MIDVIFGALLPVIVTLALGMLAGWRHDEDLKAAQSLNRMVLIYALPLALFAGTIVLPKEELLSDWRLVAVLLVGTVVPYLIAYIAARYLFRRDRQAAALQGMAFGFPSIAFTGIPILTPLIGNKATIVVDVAGLTGNIIILPLTLILLSYSQNGALSKDALEKSHNAASVAKAVGAALRHALTQPVVLSPVLAVVIVLTSTHLPAIVTNSFRLLGSTVGGLSLFASGIILQAQSPHFSLPAAVSTAARLIVIPGLTYLGLTAIGETGDLRTMTVLALGVAAAPMQVILSTRYGSNESENASLLLYTNVLCIPTLAFFYLLMK